MGYSRVDFDGFPLAMEGVSRRKLLARAAAAVGGAAGAGLLGPGLAWAGGNRGPRPIPGGFGTNGKLVPKHPFVHVLPPGIGFEMSTITDFDGVVAGSETRGHAHGSDGTEYDFDLDMRFMHGRYRSLDGRKRTGAFGFI